MRIALALVIAASVAPAPAAELSAVDVRALLSAAGVNPGTSSVIDGDRKTIRSVHVLKGLRRGDFVIRIHIGEGHGRQAGQ